MKTCLVGLENVVNTFIISYLIVLQSAGVRKATTRYRIPAFKLGIVLELQLVTGLTNADCELCECHF